MYVRWKSKVKRLWRLVRKPRRLWSTVAENYSLSRSMRMISMYLYILQLIVVKSSTMQLLSLATTSRSWLVTVSRLYILPSSMSRRMFAIPCVKLFHGSGFSICRGSMRRIPMDESCQEKTKVFVSQRYHHLHSVMQLISTHFFNAFIFGWVWWNYESGLASRSPVCIIWDLLGLGFGIRIRVPLTFYHEFWKLASQASGTWPYQVTFNVRSLIITVHNIDLVLRLFEVSVHHL